MMNLKLSWVPFVALMTLGCGTAVVPAPTDAGPDTHVVLIRVLGEGTGQVIGESMINCHTGNGARCDANVPHGATLRLEARADEGSSLVGWNAPTCGSDAACNLVVDADMTLEVTFAREDDGLVALTLLTAGDGTGRITSDAGSLDCDGECSARFPRDTRVTLTAVAIPGSSFVGWSGVCAGNAMQCTVVLEEASTAVATFARNLYEVEVALEGAGMGVVTSNGGAIDCGPICRKQVGHGDEVILTATPAAGSELLPWGGACASAGAASTCVLTVLGDVTVSATFGQLRYEVQVTRSGDGLGRVTASGIDCGSDCTEEVVYGTVLNLTPGAVAGSEFQGWDGDCEGTGVCALTVTRDTEISAGFALRRYAHTVNVTSVRGGAGSVTSRPAGVNCAGSCVHQFAHGQLVTFTATRAPGSSFTGWTDSGSDCTGRGPCTVTVGQARTLTATFEGNSRVVLNPADRDPDVRVRDYDLLGADLDLDFGGVRSNVSIPPGAGVFYFEGHRTTHELGPFGVGVCSAAYDLNGTSVGSTDQAFGVTSGGIDHNNIFLGLFDALATDHYGMVVDYRGANPIVHVITRDYDFVAGEVRPHVRYSLTMSAVTTPVFILVAGLRTVVGTEIEINPGHDTTNFPFHYDVDAILRAEGLSDEADALVMGWGSTYAGPLDDAPVVLVSANQSVANGATVTVTASALDAEDGDLTDSITWELLSSPHYEGRVTGHGATFSFAARGVGIHPARARVVDSAGHLTEATVRVSVGGPVAMPAEVRLMPDALSGTGVVLDPSGTRVRFTGLGKMGIRANQSCYGCYWYFEFSRLISPENMGGGVVTGMGNLNPYDWADVPQSVATNVLGGSWRNLIPKASFRGPNTSFDTYGLVVDYRNEHPIVYVIVDDLLHYEVVLDDVWTELYPMLYGNPLDTAPGSYEEGINFGASPFVYDPISILSAEGVDTTGLTVGWGM